MAPMPSNSTAIRVDAAGEPLRLLHVHAHPDDESSKGAATTAMYVAQGVEVLVATCTGGERGSILNPKMDTPENWARISSLREAEMARAKTILGIEQTWLGYIDSGLPEGDPLPPLPEGSFASLDPVEAARPLVEAIRRLRPHVMTTYDENGGYPHPDHIQVNRISLVAFDLAADPGYAPELGEPWEVAKLYYINAFHRQKLATVARHLRTIGTPSEDLEQMLAHFDESRDRLLTTRVDVRDYLQVCDDALRAHATQVDPDGPFFRVPHDVERLVWGTDDFELHRSRVGVTLPETDLFAGVREAAGETR